MRQLVRACLLISLIIAPLGPVLAQTPPPASGPWDISDVTTISDQVVDLKGNLTVKAGGLLVLENVTLLMNMSRDGDYHIKVEAGGELRAGNSTFTSASNYTHYNFSIYGKTTLLNCTIERTWSDWIWDTGGLEIFSSSVSVTDCRIRWSKAYGTLITGCSPRFTNTTFTECNRTAIVTMLNARPVFERCTIINNLRYGMETNDDSAPEFLNGSISNFSSVALTSYDWSTPRMEGNLINGHSWGAIETWDNSSPIIKNNNISNNNLGGFSIYDDSSPIIEGNNITDSIAWGIIVDDRATPVLLRNNITRHLSSGISCWGGAAPRIEWNNISNTRGNGIESESTSSPLIANNIIGGHWNWGVACSENSTALIENNTIRWNGWLFGEGMMNSGNARPVIRNNTIDSNLACGIRNIDSATPVIEYNTITRNFNHGILSNDTAAPVIRWNNVSGNNLTGILNAHNSKAVIENNTVSGNQWHGIQNNESSTAKIVMNRIFGNVQSGVACLQSSAPLVERNTIYQNSYCGVESRDSSAPSILCNTIEKNTAVGIVARQSSGARIENNTIRDNPDTGILVQCNLPKAIRFNKIERSGKNGLLVDGYVHAASESNTFTDNAVGIRVSYADLTQNSNYINGGTIGLDLYHTSPVITGLNITGTEKGIKFSESNATVSSISILSTRMQSLYCTRGSSPLITNCTTTQNTGTSFLLGELGSSPTIMNVPFNPRDVDLDDTSNLTVMWFLHANAQDSMDQPLSEANLTLRTDGDAIQARTGADGTVRWMPVHGSIITKAGEQPLPFQLTVEKDGDTMVWENITVNRTGERRFAYDFMPEVAALPSIKVIEDIPYSFDVSSYLSDPDNDPAALAVAVTEEGPGGRNVTVDEKNITVVYGLPVGQDVLSFEVSDGLRNVTGHVSIEVQPRNDLPIIRQLPDVNATEDIPLVVDLTTNVSDEESARADLALETDSPYATIDGLVVTFLFPENVTAATVNITVKDPDGGRSWATLNVSVTPVNDPPELRGLTELEFVEDETGTVNLAPYLRDPDTSIADLKVTCNSAYCTVTGLSLTLRYPDGVLGDVLHVSVSDGQYAYVANMTVKVKPVNDPPVVGVIPTLSVIAGKEYVLDMAQYISDIDTPRSRLSITSNSPFIRIMGLNATIIFPQDSSSVKMTLAMSVSDGINSTTATVNISVSAASVKQTFITTTSMLAFVLVPIAIIATAVGILLYRRAKYGWYQVERVMVVAKDGRLMAHAGDGGKDADNELVSSMLTAVQQFIDEVMANKEAGAIKEFQYEGMKIALERGKYVNMAVFLKGYVTDSLRKEMGALLERIEKEYRSVVDGWDGTVGKVSGIGKIISKLIKTGKGKSG